MWVVVICPIVVPLIRHGCVWWTELLRKRAQHHGGQQCVWMSPDSRNIVWFPWIVRWCFRDSLWFPTARVPQFMSCFGIDIDLTLPNAISCFLIDLDPISNILKSLLNGSSGLFGPRLFHVFEKKIRSCESPKHNIWPNMIMGCSWTFQKYFCVSKVQHNRFSESWTRPQIRK